METHRLPAERGLPQIRLVKLRIDVKWRRPYFIPGPLIANTLRGAIAITFRKLVCPEQFFNDKCLPCPLYDQCAYGQLFVPTPPADADQLRLQQDLPKPFVIEPPGLHPDDLLSETGITFRLVLFGSAIDWIPFFITTIERLGRDGMGRDRMPFEIEAVRAQHPLGDETVFEGGNATLQLPTQHITTHDILSVAPAIAANPLDGLSELTAPAGTVDPRAATGLSLRQRLGSRMGLSRQAPASDSATLPSGSPAIRIRFRTPMLLKSGSYKDPSGRIVPAKEIRDRPPFGVIARRLRDRLSALCLFFGESRWNHPDFAGLGQRADEVVLRHSRTFWLSRQRTSTRTGQSHEISGFIGEAEYAFPTLERLQEFWPLLQLGEYLHVGKNAPWGHGAIQSELLGGGAST